MSLSTILARTSAAVGFVEKIFVFFAILSSITIMLVVSVDTVLRYVFHAPLFWSIDVVSRYLMVAAFYLAISYAFQNGDHIRLLAFRRLFSGRANAVADVVIYSSAAAIFVAIGTRMFSVMIGQWETGEAFIGVYMYPNWITSALVSFGSLLLTSRLVVRALQRLLDIPSGRGDADLQQEEIEELAV